jgi:hypothetical protein
MRLTGHGAHGTTVEWAGVIGRPSEFTREWSYTSLSLARVGARACMCVIAEATARQRERDRYAPPEPEPEIRGPEIRRMRAAWRERGIER